MIISTTLAGGGRAALIGDAIRSVINHVDKCLIVDTGVTDGAVEVAVGVAGSKAVVVQHTLVDAATARNFCIDTAAELGATWALTLDTDERIDLANTDLAETLARIPENYIAVLCPDREKRYMKERFIRVPTERRWKGVTHEGFFVEEGEQCMLEDITFWEVEKSQENMEAKLRNDLRLLTAYTSEHPDEARWWYYLGTTQRDLADHAGASVAFLTCSQKTTNSVQCAASLLRAAECMLALGRDQQAMDTALTAMLANAGIPDIPLFISAFFESAGDVEQAKNWQFIGESIRANLR